MVLIIEKFPQIPLLSSKGFSCWESNYLIRIFWCALV